ncbi:hypothetical protein PR202_ga08403 [Eleusine coracana subsp. coracana]|uniref:Potassium transporter n=1 Tax=Eleusine coracana subsp. coracana TaxID=191504 RepID=A0AAV5C053_ELECO|nr:hypothetical protein PR202_ga08403 [Eleusine coracana subsp. coracana]
MARRADGDLVLDVGSEKNSVEVADDDGTSGGCAHRTLGFSKAYRMKHREAMVFTRWQTVLLAYQSLGIVYGDLGTSPLFHERKRGLPSKLHQWLEGSSKMQSAVTYFVLFGTCMMIGDGALTPAISVLSAVQGIESRSTHITQDHVVILSVVILVLLFLIQRFGTSKVSFSFSPIMLLWFGSIAVIGVYNMFKYHPPVLKAVSPHYIYYYFAKDKRVGWEQLGAVILCITGAEAMFADLGHFNKKSIQMAFSAVVYPSLILAYAGQAAYLIKHPSELSTTFYSSVPEPLFWPMFVVATLSAIVASQSLISASFSIIRQSVALGCFPRVTIKHTSEEHEGQVYCPEINYLLMLVCILVTVGFRGGPEIGRAFGVAVIFVMLITTPSDDHCDARDLETARCAGLVCSSPFFVAMEGVYMSALMNKVTEGGWVPFAIALFLLVPTLAWTYGRKLKAEYEARHAVGATELDALVARSARAPGVCVFCTDLEPAGVYSCIVQYGYTDKHDLVGDGFVGSAIAALKEVAGSAEEAELMTSALGEGYVFVFGRTILQLGQDHNWLKRFVINILYRFLQKNFRSSISTLKIDHAKTLQVGMLYEI